MPKDKDTVTYLITKTDGSEFQIDIPSAYRVTFGPAFVGGGPQVNGKIPMALRFYESEKAQRAIFTDVASFRDMSIPMRIKQVKTQTKHGFVEFEGVRKQTTFQASTSEWIDPDNSDDKPKLLNMPTDAEILGEE